jgi:hypothetical protein
MGSGIDTVDVFPGGLHLLAVDDRGPADGAAPWQCRFQRLTLRIDPAASPAVTVTHDGTVLLRRADGQPFTGLSAELGTWTDGAGQVISNRLDPEAIRRLPSGNLLVSEEYMPGILEFDQQGAFVRSWPVPPAFRCMHPGVDEAAELPPANTTGRQPNKGFEGLAITPKGVVWALLQDPLLQDGALNAKGKKAGRNIRLLRVGTAPGQSPMGQFVYRLESASNGICELLALDEQRFLVIERDGPAKKSRAIHLIDVAKATDVSAIASLPADALPAGVVPVAKRMLLDLAAPAAGIAEMPEKIEGLCLGPVLADGRRTLVVASDNDLRAEEPTRFWVYALRKDLAAPPAPAPPAAK